nr:DUF881 domain-containing protein [Microlunatus panaciterrae]
MVSALNARGTDLRPGRNTDLVSLVQSQSQRNSALAAQVSQLRQEVDRLSSGQNEQSDLSPKVEQLSAAAGVRSVTGPALTVTLDDAPETVAADGIDGDLLVVHQQDIQAVANILWSGGAEAMTIQGQRVIATTGIKCVGNTVVLHGIPYAPPYVIRAIGDPARLQAALARSRFIQIYQQYVDAFGLGYQVQTAGKVTFPAYQGSLELQYARPLGSSGASGSPSVAPTR